MRAIVGDLLGCQGAVGYHVLWNVQCDVFSGTDDTFKVVRCV